MVEKLRIEKSKKQEIMGGFRLHEKDTGSAGVQIAILTERISYLTKHFRTHKKDHHSRTGLLKLISKRRKLLKYLKKYSLKRHNEITKSLEIRV